MIDSTIEEYFTRGTVTPDMLDERVRQAQIDPQEQEDLRTRDRGSREYNARAMQRLNATELALGLSAAHAAQLLQQAVAHEQGELSEVEGGAYRFRRVPPTWKKLVKETIERQNGALTGLPKLVFDPVYFEEERSGRRIFKPRTDAELIRLGNPLMQRAIGVLRRRMWDDGKGMTRWTIQRCALPYGTQELLLLHLYLEVTNEFREVAHQEVLFKPFQVLGNHLEPLDMELWAELKSVPRFTLSSQELEVQVPRVREQWGEHQEQIRELVAQLRVEKRQEFTQLMQSRLHQELQEEELVFKERAQELERMKRPGYVQAMQREIERQRQKLQQPALFEEVRQEQLIQQQHVQELEWQLEHNHIDRMKQLVAAEQKRILKNVLPKRYALATVDVQPLTVEYVVRSTGKERR